MTAANDNEREESKEERLWLWRPPEGGYIGRRGLRPKEAPEKVTGRAIYTNDVYLPGMLYLKVLRSPYAHARIKRMDTGKAQALPGVWAIVRHDDPDVDLSDPYQPVAGFMWFWHRNSILPDTADYQGVRLGAMVIGETEEICDHALKLVGEGIEWEQLPFILDPEKAIQPDAPLLHPELNSKSNVWKDSVLINQGDVEKGFASSDHVVEFREIKKEDDVWAGVEPGCIVARFTGDDLEVWYHGQRIGVDVNFISAPVFKNDKSQPKKLKVHTPFNGATFGGNAMGLVCQLARYAVIGAKKTQRPVKVVDDYAMSWEGNSFETGIANYKVGFNNDGTIVAIKIDVWQKNGLPIISKFVDVIKTPNVYVHETHSYWSRPHESCWKDGAANCTLANLVINRVAACLQMDPIEVQLRNDGAFGHDLRWLDEHVKKPAGMPLRDSLKEVVEAGKQAFGWDQKWHSPGTRRLPNGRMHGVGFYAVACWHTGARKGGVPGLSMARDGTATIFYRRPDCGQSALTTYCQIVADEIGLRYEDVKIEFTDYFYFDAVPPAGSMGSSMNTFGLVINARRMKKLLLECVVNPPVELLRAYGNAVPPALISFQGKRAEELDMRDGIIFEKAHPENRLTVQRLTSLQPRGLEAAPERGPFFVGDKPPELPEIKDPYTLARQCVFVEVEVDTETGEVECTNLVHPYDVGQSLNPDVNDQQLLGGAYAGVGVSSTEAIYYDPHTGVRLNDNLLGYPMLTILDLGTIEAPTVETHVGWSAYGLCGCSEAGKAATAAALLIPAVYNAIGKWIEETPVTPERVLRALGKA
jgi:xanthine dehydrogenase molybdenum-binding subunit